MKTIKIKAISAVIFLGATVLYGAGNESLYMGNVGRINPATAQVLTGEVQVSGIQSPTKLTLDLVLPNGSLYTVKDISVIKDGTYGVFEFIDNMLLPQGTALLNVSADNNLSENNLSVDLSLQDFEEDAPDNSSNSSSGSIAMVGGTNRVTGYAVNLLADGDSGTVQNLTIGGSLATMGDSAFLTTTQESSNLPATSPSSSIEQITYDANNMVVGVTGRALTRDDEGNSTNFTQTATDATINAAYLDELKEIFGTKTNAQWQTFDWKSSITQSALDYLLAVHKSQITTGISITSAQAKAIRQSLLSRLSYVNRNFINGCLSGYDLNFTGINLQYADWRGKLKDLTGAMLVQAAASVLNAAGKHAGIQGAYFDEVIWSGSETVTNISLAFVYTGGFVGITNTQMAAIDANQGGTLGIVMSPAQSEMWSGVVNNCQISMTWGGYDYWEGIFDQLWYYTDFLEGNPKQYVYCTY